MGIWEDNAALIIAVPTVICMPPQVALQRKSASAQIKKTRVATATVDDKIHASPKESSGYNLTIILDFVAQAHAKLLASAISRPFEMCQSELHELRRVFLVSSRGPGGLLTRTLTGSI